uniref:Putative ovule protein n=1 Tax=Solanum chacoense TaxID=4108 RepID=A0A0V0IWE0_SOLCH
MCMQTKSKKLTEQDDQGCASLPRTTSHCSLIYFQLINFLQILANNSPLTSLCRHNNGLFKYHTTIYIWVGVR